MPKDSWSCKKPTRFALDDQRVKSVSILRRDRRLYSSDTEYVQLLQKLNQIIRKWHQFRFFCFEKLVILLFNLIICKTWTFIIFLIKQSYWIKCLEWCLNPVLLYDKNNEKLANKLLVSRNIMYIYGLTFTQ